ncbi:CrcB family protein [Microbacterium sp.]|uniref:fluoride efflux transporter FluC n=1 Tax=Microbacterium sp. TaxID=51671 RepID=UPI0025E507EB|nr:CrcB family protein [Microbacterium sp.]
MASARWFSWRSLALAIGGGGIGVALRAVLLAPVAAGAHPLVVPSITLAMNLAGSFLLGAVVGRLDDRHPRTRTFFGTGLIGGFTSYSAFAVQTVTTGTAAPVIGLLLILVSLFGGVILAALGLVVGRRSAGVPAEVEAPEEAE